VKNELIFGIASAYWKDAPKKRRNKTPEKHQDGITPINNLDMATMNYGTID
jgi:hypothetical protein